MERFRQKYEYDGFMADSFSAGFNEDLIYEYLGERFKDDDLIYVLSKEATPPNCGRLAYLDFDRERFVVAPDHVSPPRYEIKPDYFPIETMFENFDKFEAGDMRPYTYVPVANPIIPTNKLYDCDEHKMIDTAMITRGYQILDPTPGQAGMCDSSNSKPYSDDLSGKYFDRYSLKICSPAAQRPDTWIIGLEFNPFNPRSAKMIQKIEWVSNTVVEGAYEYRGKLFRFKYDLRCPYFRYHSDIWMKKLDLNMSVQNHYQMFDMVCLKRFFEEEKVERNYGIGDNFFSVMIEPIITDRVPYLAYSVIGPWKGAIERGISKDSCYLPYLTPRFFLRGLSGEGRFRQ
jgi:hypothetical protein